MPPDLACPLPSHDRTRERCRLFGQFNSHLESVRQVEAQRLLSDLERKGFQASRFSLQSLTIPKASLGFRTEPQVAQLTEFELLFTHVKLELVSRSTYRAIFVLHLDP